MDKSTQDQGSTKRLRRCVQSKLSFSSSFQVFEPRAAAASPPDALAEDKGNNSERIEQGKRKRNKTLKTQDEDPEESADTDKEAPESRGCRRKSIRSLKNKHSKGESPRKNRTPTKFGYAESSLKKRTVKENSGKASVCNAESQFFCDLWSEAKKATEENLRLSVGKQTHPFFSICRASKRSSESKHLEKSEKRSSFSLVGDNCNYLPPIHVFDSVQDDVAVLNWENWTFLEASLPKFVGDHSMEVSTVVEASTKSLILEAAIGKDTKSDNLFINEKMNFTYKVTGSTQFSSEVASNFYPSYHLETQDNVGNNFSCSSAHYDSLDNLCQDKMHAERLASYSHRSLCFADCSLWTEKYRPEISLEVCGNTESVKLLNEWLKSWQERVVQNLSIGNNRSHSPIEENDDSSYDSESDMDELDVQDSLKNVLLITGPVGSGKSAAIYACAREQGFKIIEVNASSLRNGAYMRQTFGEGVDSLGLTHWFAEDQTNQQCIDAQELQSGLSVIAEIELGDDSARTASRLCSGENATEKNSHCHIANKTLFLFEEVDVVFDEDHGFISMIFKLAETTKRPIILTSNLKRPILPHLLDRLVLDFKTPSFSELLHHASMVCAFEKVQVSYSLLEHIIKACVGDIRRILLLLQFWCQGLQGITEKGIQHAKSSVPFDIGALHLSIPKLIPWDFRCELSEWVEEEIRKTVSAMEEHSIVKEVLQQNVISCEIVDPVEKISSTTIKSRKKRKLRKDSISHAKFSDCMNHPENILYDSDSSSVCFHRINKHKIGVVLSSQSADELSSDEIMPKDKSANCRLSSDELKLEDTSTQANDNNFLAITTHPTSQIQELNEASRPDQINESMNALVVQNTCDISEKASTSHLCDTSRIQDAPCMPESSFISGDEINMNYMFISQEVSHSSGFSGLYGLNISPLIQPRWDSNNADGDSPDLSNCSKNHVGIADVHAELLQRDQEIGCFENEEERRLSQNQLMDECSHSDFSEQPMPMDATSYCHEIASISKTWRRLRSCHHQTMNFLSSNAKDVSLVASLTSELANLISEADIMFRSCNLITCDNFDPTCTPCVEPDSVSWYDEQVELVSTFALHGLGFYTMKFAAVGSCLGCNNTSDLAQEMLASSTGSNALGKLLTQGSNAGKKASLKDSHAEAPPSLMSLGRESAAELYNAILPIVPTRLSMLLKGDAFHEYFSFVGQISRFECTRLAASLVETQKRRSRSRMHYLSSGAHQLSAEQVELLAQRSCYWRQLHIK